MRKHKKGFTIVELVIVIAVIGILSAILIPTFVNVTENAKTAALKSDLANAYSMYVADAADGEKEEKDDDENTVYFVDIVKQSDVVLVDSENHQYAFDGEWKSVSGKNENKVAYTIEGTTKTPVDVTFGGYKVYSNVATEIDA